MLTAVRMLLSLCLIARNEERFLPGCLSSVKGVVDELIVVDTGSTDRTVELARSAGAKVISTAWADDFSAPRNLALAHAKGRWVLQLDADERLAAGAGKRLRAALKTATFDCGLVRLHDAASLNAPEAAVLSGEQRLCAPVRLPRVLRRTDGLTYTGVVHESPVEWLVRRGLKVADLGVDLVHLGAVPELRSALRKSDRNLRLLRRQCELTPDDITPRGYLAFELMESGQPEEARQVAEQAWPLVGTQPKHRSVLRVAVVRTHFQLKEGDAAGALATVDKALAIEGELPDLFFLKGCACEAMGMREAPGSEARRAKLEEALAQHRRALALHGAPGPGQLLAGSTSWAANLRVGTELLLMSRPAEALQAFTAAGAAEPAKRQAALGRAESLLNAGASAEAVKLLEGLLDDRADAWLLAASAAQALGSQGDAALLFEGARRRADSGYLDAHRVERHAAMAAALK